MLNNGGIKFIVRVSVVRFLFLSHFFLYVGNKALNKLILPTSLLVISDLAFAGCELLQTILIPT